MAPMPTHQDKQVGHQMAGSANRAAPLAVFNLFLKTARAILKDADGRLEKAAGLSASTYVVLMALEMSQGTMTGSKLAHLTGTEPHNI